MNAYNKQTSFLNKTSFPNKRDNRNQKARAKNSSPSVPELIRKISPSIETYLEKSAKSQEKLAEAEIKIADAFSSLAEHMISGKLNIKLNFYGAAQRKKSKKSNDPLHRKVKGIIIKMREKNKTYEEIAKFLEDEKIPTFTNRGNWHAQTVHRLFKDYLE